MPAPLLTIHETAHFAGAPRRRVEKAVEVKVLPARKAPAGGPGRGPDHGAARGAVTLDPRSVVYLAAVEGMDAVTLPEPRKKALYREIARRKTDLLAPVELAPGLTLDLAVVAGDAWARASAYLEAREAHIHADPAILGGEPVIRGTRITARSVKARLDDGETIEELLADYPALPRAAFEAAAIYAETHPPRGRPSGKPWRKAS